MAATCTLCVQVTSAARCEFLGRLATILISVADADASAKDANQFYLVEVAVALIKDGQFEDLNGYLKAVVNGLAGKNEDVEVVGAGQFSCVNDPQWRMVNFCVLLAQLCQRKAPKSLFTELCNEYCRDQDRLRQAVEAALVPVYWPAPKPRATGPPPDLMNMLSGLLGQAPRR